MVYEKARELGGILSLGIPDYKLDKSIVERRIDQLREEGVNFSINTHVGVDVKVDELLNDYDAVCLCGGSSVPRSLDVDGSALKGIHHAMDYLIQQNDINQGVELEGDRIDAKDKNVVIIGGGDTGADCLGVALRQGAKDVFQIELMPEPPKERTNEMPWPYWPMVLKTNTAHEEGGERLWSIATKRFSGADGHVKEIHGTKLEWIEEEGSFKMKEVEESDFTLKADLVLFAMGFLHPEQEGVIKSLNLDIDRRGNIKADKNQTNQAKIFTAGDMHLGQSLVCKAIADGRKAAKSIGIYLNAL
jgi:glutamate synthase (NADPH/NADH) small chain